MLDNTKNQPTKLKRKNWVEMNDDSRRTYNTNIQIKFKTLWDYSLCDYSDVYITVRRTITITGAGDDDAARPLYEINKGVIFKNCAKFTDFLSEMNNTQIDNVKYIDVVMPMYNLIEYSNNYLKTSGSLWQYYIDDQNHNITPSESFKYNIKTTRKTPAAGNTKDVQIAEPLKYFSDNYPEMPLINCEINFILTWSRD